MRYMPARYFTVGRRRPIRLIVVHSMESPEGPSTAENVAAWFARPDTRRASAHVCVDANSTVRCVLDSNTAWAAKGANADGLHLELAGRAAQNREQWLDAYGLAMLERAAEVVAAWCTQYRIPPVRLTVRQVRAGERGLCGHVDVTAAYPPGTGHTDPGGSFPWDFFLVLVREQIDGTAGTNTPPEPEPVPEEDVVASKDEVRQLIREELDRALPPLLIRITGGRRVRGTDGRVVDPDKDHVSIADVMTALDDVRDGVAALLARET